MNEISHSAVKPSDAGEMADVKRGRAWAPVLGHWFVPATTVAAGTGVLLVLFWDAAEAAVRTWWTSSSYNHAFLIIPVCAFLVWSRRDAIGSIPPRPNVWGIGMVVAAALAGVLADIVGVLAVQQLAFVAAIQGLFLAVFGWPVTRALLFPLFYLYFAVPIGQFMVTPLQDFTAQFVVRALQITGLPVFLDGIFISIPSGDFEVAETCAGVRFLTAMTALGFLCANLFYRSLWRRIAFIALSALIPIVANGIRAYGIVMYAHLTSYETAASFDHIFYGWIFFSFVTFLLLLTGMTFREKWADSVDEITVPASGSLAGAPANRLTFLAAGAAAILGAGAVPAYLAYADNPPDSRSVAALPSIAVAPPWRPRPALEAQWRPNFQGADVQRVRGYTADGRAVDLFIAYYADQRQGSEVVNSLNRFGEDDVWKEVGYGTAEATVDGQALRVRYTRLLSRTRGRMVWHWYWIDGKFTASRYVAKLLQARARLLGGREAAAVIAVAADYQDTPSEAFAVLRDFLANAAPIGPALEKMSAANGEAR